ncbi:uncharacterized protein EV420DRAFT_1505023 [Desarmillaria tabescens]|uniref:FAD/NAD(P)-binding domain-containing protein n=1 Tax=Armillaria tabescens TaxID=1929756 RepID=A0AA39NJD9_ARMTA|nr:uncharacterized protein EV420DRAFT_1505023 [Desarmillaria tabescens]KAK0466734.1 hypothetical protein EV420DRAFT_1505023 [Desarmillaria tabescens]
MATLQMILSAIPLGYISFVSFCMDFIWISAITLCVYLVALSLGRALRRKHLQKETCVLDLERLGFRLASKKIKGTAVICGGSVGGLLAARVCHDHFEDVVIVEPESWLNSEDARRTDSWNQENRRSRVMQNDSFQVIMVMGYLILSKLFPNFEEECKVSGIKIGPHETRTYVSGNAPKRPHAEYGGSLPSTIYASRIGLETCLRRLVLGGRYKNIRQIIGTVTGVSRSTSNSNLLDAVTVRTPEGPSSIETALVIDCTGPASAGLKWLRREGFGFMDSYNQDQLPLDDLKVAYDQKLQYTTLQFHITPEVATRLPGLPAPFDECGIIYCLATDPEKESRCMYTNRVDRNIIQICFSTMGECELPTNLDTAKACARSLVTEKPIPQSFFALLDALDEVRDNMTCSKVRFIGSTHIRYEKGVNLPSNWVALGDSVMTVNPVYGHGITKAFFGAVCLNVLLQNLTEIHEEFSSLFFRMQADKIIPLWNGTKVGDYWYRTTVPIPGETLSQGSWLRWYMKQLTILSFTDDQAGSALWHVRALLAPSIDALQPGLIFKVLWNFFKDSVSYRRYKLDE